MKYPFVLPKLPYSYDALEPHIDARTMEIHHTKHHQVYVDKLNAAMERWPEGQATELEDILKNLDSVPEAIRTAVRNHGGGHYNHSLFWEIMAPPSHKAAAGNENNEPQGKLADAIKKDFGDFAKFKEAFTNAAMGVFGSGWAWLAKDANGKLTALTAPNQDSPLAQGLAPIIGLDVWEHSYYLKYQNRRADYIAAWWNVVSWKN